MTRHGLLLTAVATVTAPGMLVILAVVGHEHVAVEASASAAAPTSGRPSEPFPVASTTPRAATRDDVAAGRRASGVTATVPSRVTAAQQVMGSHLLNDAASAGLSTSYQGTEQISQTGVGGSVTMISQVWHQGDGQTVVETSSGATASSAARSSVSEVASSDPSASPEGVFGVTKRLVTLLSRHYVAAYRGGGAVVGGRPATVVEVYRF
ncbi:MAG: hypothetical protein ACRDNS_34480, partial [Trebonia sp.]